MFRLNLDILYKSHNYLIHVFDVYYHLPRSNYIAISQLQRIHGCSIEQSLEMWELLCSWPATAFSRNTCKHEALYTTSPSSGAPSLNWQSLVLAVAVRLLSLQAGDALVELLAQLCFLFIYWLGRKVSRLPCCFLAGGCTGSCSFCGSQADRALLFPLPPRQRKGALALLAASWLLHRWRLMAKVPLNKAARLQPWLGGRLCIILRLHLSCLG